MKSSILECTLRDGSYVLDFQFTARDTYRIGRALDEAGFSYIEVGHGIGLGASNEPGSVAAATDEEYMAAASEAIANNHWGMFCIPGIATLDHIRLAAEYGMDFIRIGTNVSEVEQAKPFILLAKSLGLNVFANFMKSYVLPPQEFAEVAAIAADYGAELVYLVDSAGGMLPEEVRAYLRATQDRVPGLALGFHGHDNLGLAVANSLVCVQEGVSLIDTSLQGFGRSAGNTPTERFLSALVRAGLEPEVDPVVAMHMAETLVRPLIEQRGISSLDVVSGLALFHSSYMPRVLKVAKRYRIDPRLLIIQLCERDRVNAPLDLLEELASQLSSQQRLEGNVPYGKYYGEEQGSL